MSQTLLTMDGKVLLVDGKLISPNVNLQEKTVTPSETAQVIQPDDGYIGLEEVIVSAMPEVSLSAPVINVSSNGLITASVVQDAGYVTAGTKSATKQLAVQAAQTIIPSTSEQIVVPAEVYTLGEIKVGALSSAFYASINVTCPTDIDDLTCKNMSTSLYLEPITSSSGCHLFLVPNSGTYYLRISKYEEGSRGWEERYAEQEVTVATQGEAIAVELTYRYSQPL